MEIEYTARLIPVNENLMGEVEKLAKEGWQLVPGVQPVAIYNLVRPKNAPAFAAPAATATGIATLSIDESKISLYRNGKPVS